MAVKFSNNEMSLSVVALGKCSRIFLGSFRASAFNLKKASDQRKKNVYVILVFCFCIRVLHTMMSFNALIGCINIVFLTDTVDGGRSLLHLHGLRSLVCFFEAFLCVED